MSKLATPPDRYSEDWIEKLDNRTRLATVVNERLQTLSSDLGDWDRLSYQRRSLIKRVVWLEVCIEQQEAALSRGEEVDQGRMTLATNTLIGLFRVLGMDRVVKDVPTLHEYLKRQEAAG